MINSLKKDIAKLSALADGWSGEINPLERELFLDLLRRMYEQVRFGEAKSTPEVPAVAAAVAATIAAEECGDEEPEIEIELIMDEDEDSEPECEPEVCPAPAVEEPAEEQVAQTTEAPVQETVVEEAIEPQSEPEVEISAPAFTPEQTPAPEVEPVARPELHARPKISREVINTLYGDGAIPRVSEQPQAAPVVATQSVVSQPKATPAPQVATEPVVADVVQPKTVLGDVINTGAVRLGDSLQTDTMDVATKIAAGGVKSLRDAMGLNDKFLIMRDLFADDPMRFDVVIDELDEQPSFDDAMIYISGFSWNASSEGAKLLMNLLKLKFA